MSGALHRETLSSRQTVLHTETLTRHEYQYSCVTCGGHHGSKCMDHTYILCFGQILSGCIFSHSRRISTVLYYIGRLINILTLGMLLVSVIKPPPQDFNGNVNMEDFWKKLSLPTIGRGFYASLDIWYAVCYVLIFI